MSEKEEEKIEEQHEEKAKKSKKKSQEEFEKAVLSLAEKGMTSEKIGEALKREGIHSKDYNKKIKDILGSKYVSADEKNIQEKLAGVEKHLTKNKGDKRAKRDKERVSAKLRRLRKYLKNE
jgi:ribosomal protein S15P/S13E